MKRNISIAPCSWGIEDPGNPDNPPWKKVLDDAAQSGFKGIELGPYGYLPTEIETLSVELSSRSLRLIAGTIYAELADPANLPQLKDLTRKICKLVSPLAAGDQAYLVIIDAVNSQRNNTAGHPGLAKRLEKAAWKEMLQNIETIAAIAEEEYGVKPVVHPHAGGYIEFSDEIERFINDKQTQKIDLCLDTGHLFYAGDDPVSGLRHFSDRLAYIHFKDIDIEVYKKGIESNIGFFDACLAGVMCPIGKGCIDYSSVFKALNEIDYTGWITIEQERDPKEYEKTLDDLRESQKYLAGI